MSYDVIESPDPDVTDRHEGRDLIEQRGRVVEAVKEYTEVVEDTVDRFRIKADVPFRVTAYRHDIDRDKVDDMDLRVQAVATDGWNELQTDTFVTFRFSHNAAYPTLKNISSRNPEVTSMAKSNANGALQSDVIQTLEDGHAEKRLTGKRDEKKQVEFPDVSESPRVNPDELTEFKTVEREYPVGTARYRVDAIVPKDEWKDD